MKATHLKRFMELYRGDTSFRAAVEAGDARPVEAWALEVDLQRARPVWCAGGDPVPGSDADPTLRAYWAQREEFRQFGRRATAAIRRDTAYGGWRERQINRMLSQTNPPGWANPHYPYAIELSRGCSIGCDYCCFDAPPVTSVARYEPAQARLFAEVLDALAGAFGDGARCGFLYWATEPLDNPDYEEYLRAFHARFAVWPRTTTAAWYRDLARTRRLLTLASSHGNRFGVRFSINSLALLHRCLAEFTAEELADVQLVLQNPESTSRKCAAGRAAINYPGTPVDSNCNVSGVLINLLDRSVKLISPSSDLAVWPLGYAVYRSDRFRDGAGLAVLLHDWEREVMADRFADAWVPRLRDDFELRVDRRGGVARTLLSTSFAELAFVDPVERAILEAVDGQRSVGEIVGGLRGAHPTWELYARLRQMYRSGLFEDVPQPVAASTANDGGRDERVRGTVAALGRAGRTVLGG